MPRVKPVSRWLLLLVLASACLAVPAGAGARINPSVSITPVVTGTLGSNGWYVSNVRVSWQFSPLPDDTVGCDIKTITAEGHTHLLCTATWNSIPLTLPYPLDLYIDKTPPTVHAAASRKPDANGWYNKPVSFTFAGTDATSGVASCSSTSYSGPDKRNASVNGTCTDKAGNVGHGSAKFSYDADPPTIGPVTAQHGNRSVSLMWSMSADTDLCQVTRTGAKGPAKVVYRGTGNTYLDKGLRAGAKYKYTVTGFDEAENRATSTVEVTATGRLVKPVPGQVVSSPPQLSWLAVKGATYYNVQLIRGQRIMSTWPTRATLTLKKSWMYHGHRYHLRPGTYRWYVWPGFKKRAMAHYGRLVGSSSFVYGG
jgi:hypothetical protein